MKIIVTGALGHIGSRVVRDLGIAFPGSQIMLIDSMMTQRYASLFNLPAVGRYRFIEGDVTKMDLESHFNGAYVVIHLSAITDATGSFDRAEELEENNYQATVSVAKACIATGTRLVSLSSTSVYGTQAAVVSEKCTPEELKPQSPYALTKLREEGVVTKLCQDSTLQAISLRFGTVFGASVGMRFHTAINKFCWQAVMGIPITVWSTAYDQKRPYLDLLDASRAIVFIIKNNLFTGRIYNVLTLNATVREVVECIREFVPDLVVSFVDSKIMNQLSYEVSCDRFVSEGFRFSGDLKRGIGDTINWLWKANR